MAPVNKKSSSSAPSSSKPASSLENVVGLSTSQLKKKCPVKKCEQLFTNWTHLREHYRRAHSKKKPYKCTFSSTCFYESVSLSNIKDHICISHKQKSREMVKNTSM